MSTDTLWTREDVLSGSICTVSIVTSELRTWFIYLAFSFVASVYIPRPVHMMYFYDYI
jgi:hypothetical protein